MAVTPGIVASVPERARPADKSSYPTPSSPRVSETTGREFDKLPQPDKAVSRVPLVWILYPEFHVDE